MTTFEATMHAPFRGSYVAYRTTSGDGPVVLCPMPGFFPMSAVEDLHARHHFERVASLGQVVLAERLGVGMSDPPPAGEAPTLDDVVDAYVAVLDHLGVERAAVYGFYDAGTAAIRLARRYPERVSRLVVAQAFVSKEPTEELVGLDEFWRANIIHATKPGIGDDVDLLAIVAPSRADDHEFRRWWDEAGRRGASPQVAARLIEADADWNVSDDLVHVESPTLVVHRSQNRFVPVEHARYFAARIPGAQLVELPGHDHLGIVGDVDGLLDPIEEFIANRSPRRDRELAAVLFTDLVGSTRAAAEHGDRAWTAVLAEHDEVARTVVGRHGGRTIKSTGDGILAVFRTATAAIRSAQELRSHLERRGLEVRAGVHAGEVEWLGDDITGIAATIAARVMGEAGSGEVLVSGAVPPLVLGEGIGFEHRTTVELKGLPGVWDLHRPT